MGKRQSEQAPLWIPTTELPVSPGHPFYVRLNEVLAGAGFDRFVENQCRPFYAPVMGRPSLAPGRYFRLARARRATASWISVADTSEWPGVGSTLPQPSAQRTEEAVSSGGGDDRGVPRSNSIGRDNLPATSRCTEPA
jgi:hypothetical protein